MGKAVKTIDSDRIDEGQDQIAWRKRRRVLIAKIHRRITEAESATEAESDDDAADA